MSITMVNPAAPEQEDNGQAQTPKPGAKPPVGKPPMVKTNPPAKANPVIKPLGKPTPAPVNQGQTDQKKIQELKKNQQVIKKYRDNIDKNMSDIDKKMKEISAAKQICLLRLDMIADKLEDMSPKLAHKVDLITNELENMNWE